MKKLNLKMEGIGEMLSRDQMKKVLGGYGDDDSKACLTSAFNCHYEESPQNTVSGSCETNSRNQCICNARTSSVPWQACVGYF